MAQPVQTSALEVSFGLRKITEDALQNMSDLRQTHGQRARAMIRALSVLERHGKAVPAAVEATAAQVVSNFMDATSVFGQLDEHLVSGAIHNARTAAGITSRSGGLSGGGAGVQGSNPFLLLEGLKAQTQLMNRMNGAAGYANKLFVQGLGEIGNAMEAAGVDDAIINEMYAQGITPIQSYLNTVPHLADRMAFAVNLTKSLSTSYQNPTVALVGGSKDVAMSYAAEANQHCFVAW